MNIAQVAVARRDAATEKYGEWPPELTLKELKIEFLQEITDAWNYASAISGRRLPDRSAWIARRGILASFYTQVREANPTITDEDIILWKRPTP